MAALDEAEVGTFLPFFVHLQTLLVEDTVDVHGLGGQSSWRSQGFHIIWMVVDYQKTYVEDIDLGQGWMKKQVKIRFLHQLLLRLCFLTAAIGCRSLAFPAGSFIN